MIFKKYLLYCLFFVSLFFFYQRALPLLISVPTEKKTSWTSPATEEKINQTKQILEKPLKFLAMGSQCFVFTSQDDRYVIKICKGSIHKDFFSAEKRKQKEADFLSYSLAYDLLPSQSQFVFLHLDTTKNLKTKLQLIDPLGIAHFLDADHTAFYIQKKATLLSEYLKTLPPDDFEPFMKKLMNLARSSCQQGLQIRDIQPKNIGVTDGTPIWLDLGRIRKKPELLDPKRQKEELRKYCSHLKKLLKRTDPRLYELLHRELHSSPVNIPTMSST